MWVFLETPIQKSVISIILMLLLLSCTGCVEKVEQEETNQQYIVSQPPVVNITTQGTLSLIPTFLAEETINAVAYAGDTITFDASHLSLIHI